MLQNGLAFYPPPGSPADFNLYTLPDARAIMAEHFAVFGERPLLGGGYHDRGARAALFLSVSAEDILPNGALNASRVAERGTAAAARYKATAWGTEEMAIRRVERGADAAMVSITSISTSTSPARRYFQTQ